MFHIMSLMYSPKDTGNGSDVTGSTFVDDAQQRLLIEKADRYLAELTEEVGEPNAEEVAEAGEFWDRIQRARKARASK